MFSLPGAFTQLALLLICHAKRTVWRVQRKRCWRNLLRICKRHFRNERLGCWRRSWQISTWFLMATVNLPKAWACWLAKKTWASVTLWRYSMLVNDGVIEKMFISNLKNQVDPFKVSDADTMLKYIAPDWKAQESVAIFTKPGCQFCAKAKKLWEKTKACLTKKSYWAKMQLLLPYALINKMTAPQVFIGGKYIGGSEVLKLTWLKTNCLDTVKTAWKGRLRPKYRVIQTTFANRRSE